MAVPIKSEVVLTRFENIKELDAETIELIKHSRIATDTAYAPYSRFHVGAAILFEDGTILTGSNQENASYPEGLCAERVVLFAAGSQRSEQRIVAIAISAKKLNGELANVAPCGGCRQVLLEYEEKQNSPIKVYFTDEDNKILEAHSAQDLLPFGFKSSNI